MFIYEETNNLVSGAFLKCFSRVKNKKYNTTVSYFQGCIDYVNIYCTEFGRTKLTENKGVSHFHEV